MGAVMSVYGPDHRTAIGTVQDFGPGKILARVADRKGNYVSLGMHPDRTAARLAVESAHRNGMAMPPPEAA